MPYKDAELYNLALTLSYTAIAEQTGLAVDSIRGRVSRHGKAIGVRVSEGVPTGIMQVGTVPTVPVFNAAPYVDVDCMVMGDVHVPATDWQFLELAIRFAERHMRKGSRVLCIVGDLLNFDAISHYPNVVVPVAAVDELRAVNVVLRYFLKTFDSIIYSMGNHDHRFHKFFNGAFGLHELRALMTASIDAGKLKMVNQTQQMVRHGDVLWRLTHQRNYSKIKGRVADALAQKHLSNMITHHEHHVNLSRDTHNRYTTINNGMMGDWERMSYVQLVDSTSGVMCNGFSFVRNGTGHLLTPYPTMTDWDMWGLGAAALPAIGVSEARIQRLTRPRILELGEAA